MARLQSTSLMFDKHALVCNATVDGWGLEYFLYRKAITKNAPHNQTNGVHKTAAMYCH